MANLVAEAQLQKRTLRMPRQTYPAKINVNHGDNHERIIAMVRQIPSGRIATYGQIARLAGIPRNSRQVGYVLKTLPVGDAIPWYRVVNSKGEISQRGNGESEAVQRLALEEEGVEFNSNGRVRLSQFQWKV